jgi:Family of unknown function (DUF5681)
VRGPVEYAKPHLLFGDVIVETGPPASAKTKKLRGRPFAHGNSGNPKGRPKGARNKTTLAAEALLDGEAEAIIRKVIEKALDGDATALRLCVERILPPRRDRAVEFDLPEIKSVADAANASASVLKACAEGTLSPAEAAEVMALIATHLRTLDVLAVNDIQVEFRALKKELNECL